MIQKQGENPDISFDSPNDVQLGSKPPMLGFINAVFQ